MIIELDIYRVAKFLIDRHGRNASRFALSRAMALVKKGDIKGAAVWQQILEAVAKLQQERQLGQLLN